MPSDTLPSPLRLASAMVKSSSVRHRRFIFGLGSFIVGLYKSKIITSMARHRNTASAIMLPPLVLRGQIQAVRVESSLAA